MNAQQAKALEALKKLNLSPPRQVHIDEAFTASTLSASFIKTIKIVQVDTKGTEESHP